MIADRLTPSFELLTEEYVLVQAWKKTASYIRSHNWYADTLELDRTAVNLPRFLGELAEQLRCPDLWQNDPLRIVPAPKSQQWRIKNGNWEPAGKVKSTVKLRPLAHVSIRDQVAATALMLCLADRVETMQGDTRGKVSERAMRSSVVSYGNRLFCDNHDGDLHHRWGSAKLYRAYAQDYRSFLARPEIVAQELDGRRVIVLHSDLRQFYDRVDPELLAAKLGALRHQDDSSGFYELASRILHWKWHSSDQKEVTAYEAQAGLQDFSRVSLPQGLVAAGFFANVVLLDFDQSLKSAFGQELVPGLVMHDGCRYVDDLRLVLTDDNDRDLDEVGRVVAEWLSSLLDEHAPGLELSPDKTLAIDFGGDERPLVRQSRKMTRIQRQVSGGFDAIGGEDILDAVQGLLRSQQRYSESRTEEHGWAFAPVADVRDDTVARFAAARYRTTYRSLRPLLSDCDGLPAQSADDEVDAYTQHRRPRTRSELDDDARAFALGLVEQWVHDPSNVRLLRIGLDIWPAADVLEGVLDLLRPFTESGGRRGSPRRVAWYCLAEILRAGATETGFVEDSESLPAGVVVKDYRSRLKEEAIRLASLPSTALPWYVKQQALLFLAVNAPAEAPISRTGHSPDTRHYRETIRYLRGEGKHLTGADFATLALLARRSFMPKTSAVDLALKDISQSRVEQIAQRDPSFACEILEYQPTLKAAVSPRVRDDLGLAGTDEDDGVISLANIVMKQGPVNPLRNELSLLRFASRLLNALRNSSGETLAITPSDVRVELALGEGGLSVVTRVELVPTRVKPAGSIYLPPPWCPPQEKWRFQLGFLLRFILTARSDFVSSVRSVSWRERQPGYRRPESHWYQKVYGLFSGRSAFGDDWLPVSDWVEQLLFSLLSWPGCCSSEWSCVQQGLDATCQAMDDRVREIEGLQGPTKSVLLLPWRIPRPDGSTEERPLRGCIVQLAIPSGLEQPKKSGPAATNSAKPGESDPNIITSADPTCSAPDFRRVHRNHLSSALAAVESMLNLRETHRERGGRLDWLILPELSVHPEDVITHLIPFARAHKAIVLAGLTYQELLTGAPLFNSALWVVPVWSPSNGLQINICRQGKQNLAPAEEAFGSLGVALSGFRPCQWLVGYEWSNAQGNEPLWLSAAICYDATDLDLAADLRGRSDVFAIPALNRDITTFDHMAFALHYHMFQMVVVANNGQFGGSNAYWPRKEAWVKQVFHLHGQPQASIGFFEIDSIPEFQARRNAASGSWKPKPAGL